MPAIFNAVFSDEAKIPFAQAHTLIESYRDHKQTGVVRLCYHDEERAYVLLKRGELVNAYLGVGQTVSEVPAVDWLGRLEAEGEAFVRLLPLSPLGVLMSKILIQSTQQCQPLTLSLAEQVEKAGHAKEASILYLEGQNACGAILFPGKAEVHAIHVTADGVYDGTGIPDNFLKPDGQPCAFVDVPFDPSIDAWQEYVLRRAFAQICESTLSRFAGMAGRALVDSLIRLVVVFASRKQLDIKISSRLLVDQEVFANPSQAADHYRSLLTEMFSHFSAVIGPRLLASILREVVTSLPAPERNAAQQFSLVNEGYYYE